ncbi:MAG: tRNA (adenosine(37)-N6)-threonylcarbamoyltransferase complex ATPase subunit type 1 TsaE [Coprobacillus sp.]|nr:tRNA (adenosine(37)-N6)-threonylcarbamoyltransferase complex ATPase subunit type 1 TsaE [Coprobacillus sp.]
MKKTLITLNEQETMDYGAKLANLLEPGTVVCLIGELGAGKTTFAKGFAKGLGITDTVTSPTFNIMKIYDSGSHMLIHIDAYRLVDQNFELGLDELIGEDDTFTLIEWPEFVSDLVPFDAVTVEIKVIGEDKRQIDVKGFSDNIGLL